MFLTISKKFGNDCVVEPEVVRDLESFACVVFVNKIELKTQIIKNNTARQEQILQKYYKKTSILAYIKTI